MPRDIPVGNGQFLVCFDDHYQIRDVYFPHVGQENHAGGQPCRFGVFTDVPIVHLDFSSGKATMKSEASYSRLCWTPDGFEKRLRYIKDTLVTAVTLDHKGLLLTLRCNDVVD